MRKILLAAAALAAMALPAKAQNVTLRVGTWLPAHHLIMRGIIQPWAEAIERETGGSLKLQIMDAPIGRPPDYFDNVVNGVIDAGYGVSGHNPGRFTLTQLLDLPFMSPDPWSGSAASWLTYQRWGAQYKEHAGVHIAGLFVHSEPWIFLRGEPLKTLEDLKGKKIRVGGNVTGRIVAALGGQPVQLPPTEAQQAMMSGVADGITFPMESIEFFKITPVIKSAMRVPGGLYTDTFWIGINEAKWKALSPAHKAAVDKHSGMIPMQAGWAWTNGENWGREALEKNKVQFVAFPDAEVAKMKAALKPLEDDWLAEAKKRGLPGDEILAYARFMVEKYRSVKRVNVP
jgi:TRAP-type C4-dicarboxylate transport system substrate-binding protein